MAGEETDEEEGPSLLGRTFAGLKARTPEAGVTFFGVFLLAMVMGLLLALSGMLSLAVVVFFVASVSLLAMLIKPSPKALAERAAREAPPEREGGEEEEEEEPGQGPGEGGATTDLLVDGTPAPASGRRGVPAPPPEPPPLEDIVVDLGDEEPAGEAPAPSEEPDGDDVWVET